MAEPSKNWVEISVLDETRQDGPVCKVTLGKYSTENKPRVEVEIHSYQELSNQEGTGSACIQTVAVARFTVEDLERWVAAAKDKNVAEVSNDGFHKEYDEAMEEYSEYIYELSLSLGCSGIAAEDVWYLRGRSRWTQELETELIRLHKEGIRPNMNEFGHKETS